MDEVSVVEMTMKLHSVIFGTPYDYILHMKMPEAKTCIFLHWHKLL